MISIVIPTYNESSTIEENLTKLLSIISPDDEVIVVDGRSEDGTADKVKKYNKLKFIQHEERGRAVQMNRGVGETTKDYVLFLHADTTIDEAGLEKLKYEINNNRVAWGWFSIRLNSPKYIYRILETLASCRTILAHDPLGDHGIFVRKELFKTIGGYPEIPIMEDIELVKKLKKISEGKRINHYVLTSVRRFERAGIFRTVLNISMMRIAYYFGKSPDALSRWYLNHR